MATLKGISIYDSGFDIAKAYAHVTLRNTPYSVTSVWPLPKVSKNGKSQVNALRSSAWKLRSDM